MVEIVVYFDNTYSRNETIQVDHQVTRADAKQLVTYRFGNNWYSFDINYN